MKEQQESKPKKPNILVRLIALLVTAALLLGALVLVVYRDRLNLDALARWFEYRNLETSESGEAAPFSHAGGRQASFAYLDSGVLLASDTGARYYSFSGELYAEEVRNLEQPVLTHSSGYGVVYDAGGQDLFLFSGVEEAFHLTLDSGELLSARVNDSGWLAVTSHGGGWRGLVTVYDSSYNTEEPPIQIRLSTTFVVDAAVSPDCKTVAVVTKPFSFEGKRKMSLEGDETTVKLKCNPSDTLIDIYHKFNELLLDTVSSEESEANSTDTAARIIGYIPGLIKKWVIWFLKTLDYFGLLPSALINASPFHGSMFITSMASLNIPPIRHHLYNFGNVPVFIAFGAKRAELVLNEDGSVTKRRVVDFVANLDERICDGYYYASALKMFKKYLVSPEALLNPPEEVVEDIR